MNGDREATSVPGQDKKPVFGSDGLSGAIVAFRRDGGLYRGDLLADIFDYRDLRGRILRGDDITEVETVCMAELERKLARSEPEDTEAGGRPSRRKFHRFRCDVPGVLHREDPESPVEVRVQDIGAGGVRIACDAALEIGNTCKLVLERREKSGIRKLALPSRVTWASDGTVGLSFAGTPRYEETAGA
jgi:hypothetical protein